MPSYRVDFIDRTNHISRPAEIVENDGDLEAMQKAKQFVDDHDVELWEKGRPVMRFPHNSRK